MESELAVSLGLNPNFVHWVLIPVLIFLARIVDVSINTLRVIFMLNGKMFLSTVMGFFEALVWLLAISQILQNLGNVISYLAYSGGFAAGIMVGMQIEKLLAIGKVIVRVITVKEGDQLIDNLEQAGYRLTKVEATGTKEEVVIVFLVIKRKKIPELTRLIESTNPNAFFTIEGVRYVRDHEEIPNVTTSFWSSFLRGRGRR